MLCLRNEQEKELLWIKCNWYIYCINGWISQDKNRWQEHDKNRYGRIATVDSCFAVIGARQHCVAKICNVSPTVNVHQLQNHPFTISSSVLWTHLCPETRVATSLVSGHEETKCQRFSCSISLAVSVSTITASEWPYIALLILTFLNGYTSVIKQTSIAVYPRTYRLVPSPFRFEGHPYRSNP